MFEYDMFSDITDCTLKEINELLKDSEPGDKLTLNIASYGGEIFMALGIIDLLKSKEIITECNVLGLAASSAALIALSCQTVNMTPNSSLMLHSAWNDSGEIDEGIKRCNAVQLDIIHKRNQALNEDLFNQDNWFSAEDCLKLGLCDNITIANFTNLMARYCASLRGKDMQKFKSEMTTEEIIEEVKKEESMEQAEEAPIEEKEVEAEQAQEEMPSEVSLMDVIEKLAERVAELERRLNEPAMESKCDEEPKSECSPEQERLNAVMQNLCKLQSRVAIGDTPKPQATVHKVNKSFLRMMGD